jgi:membrane protease YdiL (CAAX protease family)
MICESEGGRRPPSLSQIIWVYHMSSSFLDAVKQGKNQWWRYLLGILVILFSFIGLGLILSGIAALLAVLLAPPEGATGNLQQQLTQFIETPSALVLAVMLIPFVCAFLSLFFVMGVIHERDVRSLIASDRSIRWSQLGLGFGVWFVLLLLLGGVGYLLSPSSYAFTFNPSQWFILLPVALILIPIQTSAEELVFRGYLLQGSGLLTRQPLILILLNSLLFMVPHLGNPEMQRGFVWGALTYWILGVFFIVMTLKSNRLELALGVHAAQNLFVALVLNSKDSALPTHALWTITETVDPRSSFWGLLVLCCVFYTLFFLRRRPD